MLNGILLEEMDMSNVCRTCLETGELVSIFNPCTTGPCLIEKLTSVTAGKLFDCMGLPTQICNDCVCEINRAYKFASKCHETDRKLREFIRNSNAQSANESATIMADHFEKVGLDVMENPNKWINSINQRFKKQKLNSHNTTAEFANSRSINVKINYDSDESDFGEMHDFHNFAQNNEIQNGNLESGCEQQSSTEVNRKRKINCNDEFLAKNIKTELTSNIDLGTTEFYMDADFQIKTENCDSDNSLENYQNYLDQESQIFNTHFTKNYIEPEICNLDIKPKTKNSLKTPKNINSPILKAELTKAKTITEIKKSPNSQINLKHGINTENSINQDIDKEISRIVPLNIQKQISPNKVHDLEPLNQEFDENMPPNQEFYVDPLNCDKEIPPNPEFSVEHLNIDEQTPPNQECDVYPLNIDKQMPPNQEFDVNSLNIDKQKPLNQKFNVKQLNFDKETPPNQEFDGNSFNIDKQKHPNQKFQVEQLNFDKQKPPNQEFDVNPLNIDKQIPPNQDFEVNSLNIDKQKTPNQEFNVKQLNFDKETPPNQEFDGNSFNIDKQKHPNQKFQVEQLNFDKQKPPNQEFDVEQINIDKQILLNQEFNEEQLNIDTQIPLNREFNVEPLNINEQMPLNREFNVEPLNINKQMPLNQEFNVDHLNIDKKNPLNQEFIVEQLNIDKKIPLNQEFDVEELKIDEQIPLNQEYNEEQLNINKQIALKQEFDVEQLNIDKKITLNQEFDVDELKIDEQIPLNQEYNEEQLNINKQIALKQEFDVDQLNIDKKITLNQEFDVEQLNIDEKIPLNQEFDVEQLNIDTKVPLNQEFDATNTVKQIISDQELVNKKLELKLSKCGIYFEQQTIADIDLTVDHSDFEGQMETLQLLEMSDVHHPELTDECDVFEDSIQELIDQESVPMRIDDIDAKLDIKSEIDPLGMDESIDCETIENELSNSETTESNEIIYAEINIETVHSDFQGDKHYYKINSNICSLNNENIDNAKNLNYQNVVLKNSESLTSANYLHNVETAKNTLENGNNVIGEDIPNNNVIAKQKYVAHKPLILKKKDTRYHLNKLANKNFNKPFKTYSKLQNLKNSQSPNNSTNIIDLTTSDESNSASTNLEIDKTLPNTETTIITRAELFNAKKYRENNRIFRQCNICLRYVRRLRKHIRIHNKKRDYMCEICGNLFTREQQFTAHQKMHKNDMKIRYKCEMCPKEFRKITQLNRHETAHKKMMDTCIVCGEKFTKTQDHICKQTEEEETPELRIGEIQCDKCDDVFTTIDTYNSHYKMHKNKKTCTECDLHFGTTKRLVEHLKSHKGSGDPNDYSLDKPFSCEICGRKFTFDQQLTYHMKIHKNKPTECPFCAEIFPLYQQFRRHNCKITDCPNCDKSFDSPAKLKVHFRIHRMNP